MAKQIMGRKQDFILDKNNDLRVFTCSDEIFWGLGTVISAYQFVQNLPGELTLKIETQNELNISGINKKLLNIFPGFVFDIVLVSKIQRTQRGKFLYLKQNLKIYEN